MEDRHELRAGGSSVESVRMLIEMSGAQEFLDNGKSKIFESESLTSLMYTVAEVIVSDLGDKSTARMDLALGEFHNSFAFGYQIINDSGEVTDEVVGSLKDDIE